MVNISFALSYLQAYIVLANILSFMLYGYDKLKSLKSSKKTRRVSENRLLLSSFVGGSIGSILAMLMFRHKIKKPSFLIKFFLVVVIQTVVFYILIKKMI
jgi:uncharacterized membrane protein YsdA (DUF1294 family)